MFEQWRTRGYAIEENILHTDALVDQLETQFAHGSPTIDWGADRRLEFPSRVFPALNDLAVDSRLLCTAKRLLETENIRLIQCVAWPKYGNSDGNSDRRSASNRDQRMHMDYGNNTLLHPPPWHETPQIVSAIVYLSDCQDTGGGTCVVARRGDNDPAYRWPYVHMPGIGGRKFVNDRSSAEKMMQECDPIGWRIRKLLYQREILLSPAAGSVLWYRHDTWHRGTPVRRGKIRYVVNMAWARAEVAGVCQWNPGFARRLYEPFMQRYIASLDGQQLRSLGFPPKEHPYWTRSTRHAVNVRYGKDLYSRL